MKKIAFLLVLIYVLSILSACSQESINKVDSTFEGNSLSYSTHKPKATEENRDYFTIKEKVIGHAKVISKTGETFKASFKDDNEKSGVIVCQEPINLTITIEAMNNWKVSSEYSKYPKEGASFKEVSSYRTEFKYEVEAGTEISLDELNNFYFVAVPIKTYNNGVPTLLINTINETPVEDKVNWIPGHYAVVEGNVKEYNVSNQIGALEMKGRGNTSWSTPGFNKKPYNLKLSDSSMLLDLPEHKEFSLIANFSDKSLMRNHISYYIGSKMSGFDYTPRSRYVEVYLNNSYKGLYLLVEKVSVDENRVNIEETSKGEDLSDIMSGSFLLEKELKDRFNNPDNLYINAVETVIGTMNIRSPRRSQLIREDRVYKDYRKNQYNDPIKNYIGEYFNRTNVAIRAIRNGNYTSYKRYIDVDSFIDFMIFQEVAKNIDGNMKVSIFFYKDKGEKLVIGPLWDFDISFGNADYNNGNGEPYGYTIDGFMVLNSTWFKDLIKDPWFYDKLKARYKELRNGLFKEFPIVIDETANYIRKSAEANFKKYQILGRYTWPNPKAVIEANTFDKQVEYLKSWLDARLNWLDQQWLY